MKLFTSALLLALSTFSIQASAATQCVVEITFGGFLDARTCHIPAGSSLEILTGYTGCHVPVVLDDKCKIIESDFSECQHENTKIDSYISNRC